MIIKEIWKNFVLEKKEIELIDVFIGIILSLIILPIEIILLPLELISCIIFIIFKILQRSKRK